MIYYYLLNNVIIIFSNFSFFSSFNFYFSWLFWFLLSYTSDFFFIIVILWISDLYIIRDWCFYSKSAVWVEWQHDFDFNTHNTLFEEYVSNSLINVDIFWFSGTNHISLFKFHGFGSLLFQFSRNNDFTSFSSIEHYAFNNRVGSKSYWDIV